MRVRSYERYICAYPDQAKSYKALDETYSTVVADLLGSFAWNKLVISSAAPKFDKTSKVPTEGVAEEIPAHCTRASATFVPTPCDSTAQSESCDFELNLPAQIADLSCSCDHTLAVFNVLAYEALELEFPDQLPGCRAGWYVKEPQATDVGGFLGCQQLRWLDFFDSFLELHGAQPGSYDCCFAQVFDLDSTFEYCNRDGGVFEEGTPAYLFQTRGTSRFIFKVWAAVENGLYLGLCALRCLLVYYMSTSGKYQKVPQAVP